jgi:hypothetical protein
VLGFSQKVVAMNRNLVLFSTASFIIAQLVPFFPVNQDIAAISTIVVTTISDSGPGSLRQAVDDANSGDQITFSSELNGQAITLLSTLTVAKNLTITGPGSSLLAIQGPGVVGLLAIRGGAVVTVSGLTIRDGERGVDNLGGDLTIVSCVITGNQAGPPWDGAGISNKDGSLTILNSQVTGNSAVYASGGGIANINSTLTIDSSTISNNSAWFGGGAGVVNFSGNAVIMNTTVSGNSGHGQGLRNDDIMSITNSTVSNNNGGVYNYGGTMIISNSAIISNTITEDDGGGIRNTGLLTVTNSTVSGNASDKSGGGIYNETTLNLNNVTLTQNTADLDTNGSGEGGGIFSSGSIYFKNSIIAGNTDNSEVTKQPDMSCTASAFSQGYNLISDPTGCAFAPASGDKYGTPSNPLDPQLGPLSDNRGNSLTHALLPGSPAIDNGNPASPGSGEYACEPTDQRGFIRPGDGNEDGSAQCDIGAFEFIFFTEKYLLPVIMR